MAAILHATRFKARKVMPAIVGNDLAAPKHRAGHTFLASVAVASINDTNPLPVLQL
jgi:hypothetical protein